MNLSWRKMGWVAVWCICATPLNAEPLNLDNPVELHRMLAGEKAGRLEAARQTLGAQSASLDQLNYDAQYYDLDIALNIPAQTVTGRVVMAAQSLINGMAQFDVDLYSVMTVDSVWMEGVPVTYSEVGNELYITLPAPIDSGDTFDVNIFYHGTPAVGGFGAFGFNTHGSPSVPMVWSLSEPYYARNWWPCKDTPSDKADSVDIHITCPDNLFAASNGILRTEVNNGDGTKTYNWRHGHPITTYLVSLAVTNYTRLDYNYVYNGGADTMPVYFWVYPEYVASAQASYPEIVQMIGALGEYYGPYPFLDEKYAISQFVWSGGMEHQTNTSQGAAYYSWSLNVHELSHQWWGDLVTCKTWHDIWLNEGFASYTEALYQEWKYGAGSYRNYMNSMAYKGGGTVYVYDTTNVGLIFNGSLSYDKGAWVVHMLRGVMGDPVFFATLAEYRNQFADSSATTQEFRAVCEQVSGLNLEQFFNDWLYGSNCPLYTYGYYSYPEGGGFHARVKVEQHQATQPPVFDMPIDLRFTSDVQSSTVTVSNNQRAQWFDINLPFEPTSLVFDPEQWILKTAFSGVAIISDTLKAGSRDESYADTLKAARGTPPYYWYPVEGESLPPGLSLAPSGVIQGMTGVQGSYTFAVQVYDSKAPQSSMERDVTIVIGPPLRPAGDVTADGVVTSSDVIFLVNYAFKSGPAPVPLAYGDVDMTCTIATADIIYMVNYIFKGGPEPNDGCA
jgi:hypothetical protein